MNRWTWGALGLLGVVACGQGDSSGTDSRSGEVGGGQGAGAGGSEAGGQAGEAAAGISGGSGQAGAGGQAGPADCGKVFQTCDPLCAPVSPGASCCLDAGCEGPKAVLAAHGCFLDPEEWHVVGLNPGECCYEACVPF